MGEKFKKVGNKSWKVEELRMFLRMFLWMRFRSWLLRFEFCCWQHRSYHQWFRPGDRQVAVSVCLAGSNHRIQKGAVCGEGEIDNRGNSARDGIPVDMLEVFNERYMAATNDLMSRIGDCSFRCCANLSHQRTGFYLKIGENLVQVYQRFIVHISLPHIHGSNQWFNEPNRRLLLHGKRKFNQRISADFRRRRFPRKTFHHSARQRFQRWMLQKV